MDIVLIILGSLILSVLLIFSLKHSVKKWAKSQIEATPLPSIPPPQVNVNLKPLQDAMEGLPNKVLQSITSSSNTHKGVLGELIGYLQLRASYDRIIPLGNIVDIVAIKFPDTDSEGHIDFIDVKTGGRCRLSKDQQTLQKLVKEKKINFVRLVVNLQ